MPKGYHHLTYPQRCQICTLKDRGDSNSEIGKALNIHHSTISLELKRNSGQKEYHYDQAQKKSVSRRAPQPNKKMTSLMISAVEDKLMLYQWSPVQISGWLKKQKKEHVSHETIYKHIWIKKKDGGVLYKNLRHHGKKYNKRSC